jgi:enoyl-CoA hydratase/carnithine racemase
MVKWSPPYRRENVELPEFDLVEIERDGPVGRIVLNSPEKRNPLGYERLLQIEMAAKLLELDEEVRVLIIKGQGPCFSAGYDITPVKKGERQRNMPPGGYIHPERDRLWQSYDLEHARVYMTLFDLQKPVIAQIHGACLAGATELAGFCDLRVVADDARIGWPVGRNWSPGNLQYLPWLVGMTRAKYTMFTCEPMSGKEAFEAHWASESVPAERLEAGAPHRPHAHRPHHADQAQHQPAVRGHGLQDGHRGQRRLAGAVGLPGEGALREAVSRRGRGGRRVPRPVAARWAQGGARVARAEVRQPLPLRRRRGRPDVGRAPQVRR